MSLTLNTTADRKFNLITKTVTENSFVPLDPKCNCWLAINMGNGVASVNGIMIKPPQSLATSGESTGVDGGPNETYVGNIEIRFNAGSTVQKLLVIQKIFIT